MLSTFCFKIAHRLRTLPCSKLALPSYFPYSNNKKNYHFDLTGAFSNIIEESEAIEYDDDDDEDEFDDDDDD